MAKIIDDFRRAIEERVKSLRTSALVDVVVALLALVSLFFFTFAAYVWAETEYGTIAASLGLALLFAATATAVVLASRLRARRAEEAEATRPLRYVSAADAASPESNPEWWIAPVGIATGIEVLRRIGAHRLVPAFALSAVLLAALQASSLRASGKSSPK